MQSILCDICKAEIREDAQELTRVSGRVATSQEGGTMIVNGRTYRSTSSASAALTGSLALRFTWATTSMRTLADGCEQARPGVERTFGMPHLVRG